MESFVFGAFKIMSLVKIRTTPYIENVLRLSLKLPDTIFQPACKPVLLSKVLSSRINVIRANDGRNDITNKFNLFLHFYWDGDLDAFDFATYVYLFNTKMLRCSYIDFETGEEHNMMVYISDDGIVFSAKNDDIPDINYTAVPFACVEF